MLKKLGAGCSYQDLYFAEGAVEKSLNKDLNNSAERQDDQDQFQIWNDAIDQLEFHRNEEEQLCFKQQQLSIQRGVKEYSQKEKDSAMKEMKNLTEKNHYFSKVECGSLTCEVKDKMSPLLIFMVMKKVRR